MRRGAPVIGTGVVRWLAGAAAVGVTSVAGGYTLVHVARWEWHRAILAGVLFLAGEVVVVALVLLTRLRAIEGRLDHIDRAAEARVRGHLEDAAPAAGSRFAWLDDVTKRTNVFLPFLLGAGIMASVVASLVEAVARATARPALERRLAGRLTAAQAHPSGPLVGRPVAVTIDLGLVPERRRVWRAATAVVLAAAALAAVGAVEDRIETRSDPPPVASASAVELRLSGAYADRRPVLAVRMLWSTCRHVVRRHFDEPDVVLQPDGRARLVVGVGLGEQARRRVRGCLEDAVLDHVRARVMSIRPAGNP